MPNSLESSCVAVKREWEDLTKDIDVDVKEKWWKNILIHYGQPHRKYHTMVHLRNMFEHFDKHKNLLESQEAIGYAIVFHDMEYDPQSSDNEEESIKYFEAFAKESEMDPEGPVYETVKELILLTKTHSTDEHKTEGVFGTEDKHIFLDFDMSILGSPQPEYTQYAKHIREEYGYLPEATYQRLRAKTLKSFLQIPNIFATQIFRETFEQKARENLAREIAAHEASCSL